MQNVLNDDGSSLTKNGSSNDYIQFESHAVKYFVGQKKNLIFWLSTTFAWCVLKEDVWVVHPWKFIYIADSNLIFHILWSVSKKRNLS